MNLPPAARTVDHLKYLIERINCTPRARDIRAHPVFAPIAWLSGLALGLSFWYFLISWLFS